MKPSVNPALRPEQCRRDMGNFASLVLIWQYSRKDSGTVAIWALLIAVSQEHLWPAYKKQYCIPAIIHTVCHPLLITFLSIILYLRERYFFSIYMTQKDDKAIVPEHQTGARSDNEAAVSFSDVQQAKDFFKLVQQRLLTVNNWHRLAGKATAEFTLTDARGNEVARPAQEGDHFKIDIPGPGPATGDGYDWVQIEKIEETHMPDSDSVAMRVRPTTNPANDRGDVAHFFTDDATSSFIIKREHTTVSAHIHGRNEKPNVTAETVGDKARNATIAAGAATGFSKWQWMSLVKGLLQPKEA